ncbi:phosphate signaling complex protein PhoU [Blastopirellula sp. J2-11]|uniref:phosphate signaling complex protein PhoU n=1 Tax=Blastopirellula sp. J2-11 TaxID=2943192 RepID=UPI0021C76BD2|nr:phosphate signaling complex protein PhoU [Blastopirellula sp. J2-11]UUO04749.1 phosphate signaling complex protein PhoU [Blastopirellula sp. J2-11]
MSRHLQRDLDSLHREILSLSGLVEEMIEKSIKSLYDRSFPLAEEVIAADELTDQKEVVIEEECLKMLALHQPVAVDLRRIATVMKVNNDLERIGDLTVNIAERAKCLVQYPNFEIPLRMERMVNITRQMVAGALDAFVGLDSQAAMNVRLLDDDVDLLNREIIQELQDRMKISSFEIEPGLHCFSASRHIERIADHATNIAEDVIYLVDGEIVRHQPGLSS